MWKRSDGTAIETPPDEMGGCAGPAKVCFQACLANDWTMSVSVGIITAQMLQDAHLTDIGAQGKQSTPSAAADAEMCQNAWATPRVSKQRSAGVYDSYDSAHQGEWVPPTVAGDRCVWRGAERAARPSSARFVSRPFTRRQHIMIEDLMRRLAIERRVRATLIAPV